MSRRIPPLQRLSKRPGRLAPIDWETDDVPGGLPQWTACLDDDGDNHQQPAIVHQGTAAIGRGHVEALYLLALSCDDKTQRIHWLTLAAERGHVRAMHDLGLASAALHERRRWLLAAGRRGWAEALAELGDVECS